MWTFIVDEIVSDSLLHNVKNLQKLMTPYYRKFFTDAINGCVKDRKDSKFEQSLPKKATIKI